MAPWQPSAGLFWMLGVALSSSVLLGFLFVFPSSESLEWHHPKGTKEHPRHHNGHAEHHDSETSDRSAHAQAEKHEKTTTKFRGLDAPTSGEWDFFGMTVNMDKKATPYKNQVTADYPYPVNPAEAGPEYNIPANNPAFTYPEDLDPLFITVSTKPRILFFERIATNEEMDEVIRQAQPHMQRSQVALTKNSKGQSATQEVRTSKSTWVTLNNKLGNLEKRLTTLMGATWHEPMNVLHYQYNQHYDAHHDYFDPSMYGQQQSNRMATFFIYLNDTDAGGATTIPRANGGKMPPNYKAASCEQGIQIHPRKGSGFLLYDMRPDRSLDPYSLHGGCDVKEGTKWGGVVWFRVSTP